MLALAVRWPAAPSAVAPGQVPYCVPRRRGDLRRSAVVTRKAMAQTHGGATSAAPSTVAVIGGGIAGLACGRRLAQLGVKATVFDTGKHAPGGRASSRIWRGHVVDHAAQFACATDPDFAEAMAASGAARRWDGRLGVLGKEGFQTKEDGVDRWVGTEGFGSIVASLAKGVDVQQDVWVPPSNGIRCESNGTWSVVVPDGRGGRDRARFDAVVVAHNGKCAERLTSSTPAREVHALLRASFAASLPRSLAPGAGRFTLNQVYSLLFEVPKGVMPGNFDVAIVENEPTLRWLSSNSAKFGRKGGGSTAEGMEAWTALSSAAFGKQHKAPQEFLEGTPKEAEVTRLLLGGIERAVGLKVGTLSGANISATKLQLWGAGLPINRWASKDGVDFVWSAAHSIGIAGDWLSSAPARASTVEAAWLSGVRLAEHVAGHSSRDAGLELGEEGGVFVPVDGDFGGGGSNASSWVALPQDEGGTEQADGNGNGKKGGKGAKGGKGKDGGGASKGGGGGVGGGGGGSTEGASKPRRWQRTGS